MTPRHGKICLVTAATDSFVPGALVTIGTFLKHHPRLDAGSARVLHFNLRIKPWMTDAMLDGVDGYARYELTPHFKLWYGVWLDCITRAHQRNRHKGWAGR